MCVCVCVHTQFLFTNQDSCFVSEYAEKNTSVPKSHKLTAYNALHSEKH